VAEGGAFGERVWCGVSLGSLTIYYVILVNGVPEQVTTHFQRAQQAANELTSRYREARIVMCREVSEFETEEPTEPDSIAHGPEV
jgi:hypothetical protein